MLPSGVGGICGQRSSAEVGVEEHSRGIDDSGWTSPHQGGDALLCEGAWFGLGPRRDLTACLFHRLASHRHEDGARYRWSSLPEIVGERIYRRQVAQLHVIQPTGAGILDPMRLRNLLFLAFLVTPLVEIALLVLIGQQIGLGPTLVLVIITAVVGSYLVSRQGRDTWLQLRADLTAGALPGKTLAHGAMILVAGALLLTPGFLTDAIGFALLIPPVREAVRRWFVRRYRDRWIVLR